MPVKPKRLILPKRELYLPRDRRKLPRPAPWIWIPKRFAPKAAVAFDAGSQTVTHTPSATSPINNNTLTTAGSATVVIGVFASIITAGGTLPVPSSMTWDQGGTNQSMTAVGNKTSTDGLANVYVYAVVSPTTGNKHCQAAFSAGAGTFEVDLDCFSFTGTDTSSVANCIPAANVITDATNANTNYPTTPVSVTTANGDAACGAANSEVTTLTGTVAGAGTLINSEGAGNVNYVSAYHLAVGATTTIQFSGSASGAFPSCGVFFRIQQPQAAGGKTPYQPYFQQMLAS